MRTLVAQIQLSAVWWKDELDTVVHICDHCLKWRWCCRRRGDVAIRRCVNGLFAGLVSDDSVALLLFMIVSLTACGLCVATGWAGASSDVQTGRCRMCIGTSSCKI